VMEDKVSADIIVEKSSGIKRNVEAPIHLKKLREVFSYDIYDEIKYVLTSVSIDRTKYVPYELGNGEWLCCCGEISDVETCRFCGTNRTDAMTKINYTFLKEHRMKRLQEKEKVRKEKFSEIEEKEGVYKIRQKRAYSENEGKSKGFD
jgi:hypothetical protein